MIEGEQLYESHRDAYKAFTGEELPFWEELSWPEKDGWIMDADELNDAREVLPDARHYEFDD